MGFLSVIAAAVAAYAFGAVWYMLMAKPWMEAAGIEVGADGRPKGASSPMPYVTAFVSMVLIAGMMRHIFASSGIDTVPLGLMGGFGIGTFIVVPWLATHYGFSMKPMKLLMIDGVYNIVGCTLIGLVLVLF